ncbi:MAG TPA: PD-(D/E)XK nuclease family protein [Xanthobacteraceae bacterium]|jgi:hypothetical protein|nr:PD-(D/E)XK nuclease family protein [Xanthobacteraceae bacterium]
MIKNFGRRDAEGLITSWRTEFADISAAATLMRWRNECLEASRLWDDSADSERLLTSFISQIDPFDCFSIAGWQPNENQMSNVIAAIFNDNWGHNYGQNVLKEVLSVLHNNASLTKTQSSTVKRIVRFLSRGRRRFSIKREQRGDLSRADIDIFSPEGNFLVRIEHKIRFGTETYIKGSRQTDRLTVDARSLVDELQISPDNIIFILLSPEGKPAANREFGSISYAQFAEAIKRTVIRKIHSKRQVDSSAMTILGFAQFYGRL